MNKYMMLGLLIISTVTANASTNCEFLSVMISNYTAERCQLIKKDVKAGKMSSSTQVPGLIPAGSSSVPFEMQQLIYGPDIMLTYQCGNNHQVTFESQQDFCFFNAGNISGIVHSLINMSIEYQSDPGSSLWNRHGSINWMLHS